LRDARPNSRRFVSLTGPLLGAPAEMAFDGSLPIRRHVKAKLSRLNIGVFTGLDAPSLNRVDAERHASPDVIFLTTSLEPD
jgi:hypothetical protein